MKYVLDGFVCLLLVACAVLSIAAANDPGCHAQEFAWVIDTQPQPTVAGGFEWKVTDDLTEPSPECICHPFCRCVGTCRCTIIKPSLIEGSIIESSFKDQTHGQQVAYPTSYQSPLAGVTLAYAEPQVCGPGGCGPAGCGPATVGHSHHGSTFQSSRFRWRFPLLRATGRFFSRCRGCR